jgi:hypothetical protein
MIEVEVYSWLFVYKEWGKLRRMPVPDKGFEGCFREYLYRNLSFDVVSDERDLGLGLSYHSLSDTPHELDVVCAKDRDLFVFELKHYEVSNITKEIVFTFLGKVMDFYFRNAEVLSNYKITMFLVTINRNVDDSIRKLCITYGIKLIEPSIITLGTMDYFIRDLYQKTSEKDAEFKTEVEELVENIAKLKEKCDYSFSDIFRYRDESITIELSFLRGMNPSETSHRIKEYYSSFEGARRKWKAQRN